MPVAADDLATAACGGVRAGAARYGVPMPLLARVSLAPVLTLLLACACALAVAAPARAVGTSCAAQGATLQLCNALTDNYKHCYNPDLPRETRTWLNWTGSLGQAVPYRTVADQSRFETPLNLERTKFSRTMPARTFISLRTTQGAGNVRSVTFRHDASGRSGILLNFRSLADLRRSRITFTVLLRRVGDGAVLASQVADYRYDSALAGARAGTPEHFGPGGRWSVAGRSTSTDVELGMFQGC